MYMEVEEFIPEKKKKTLFLIWVKFYVVLQKIPDGFLKYLEGCEEKGRALLKKGGKKWVVKLNGQKLEEGWGQFAEEHDLKLGDMLIFRHEGDLEFDVTVFNLNHCDREYAEYEEEEEEVRTVEETSTNFEFKGNIFRVQLFIVDELCKLISLQLVCLLVRVTQVLVLQGLVIHALLNPHSTVHK